MSRMALRLDLVDLQQPHQAALRVSTADGERRISAMTSSMPVERLEQAAQDVRALLGLAQQEARPADDDLDLVRRPSGG